MAALVKTTIHWISAQGRGNAQSNLWWDPSAFGSDPLSGNNTIKAQVYSFFNGIKPNIAVAYSMQLDPVAELIDPANGQVISDIDLGATNVVQGTGGGQTVADTTQVLVRFKTGHRIAGRTLQGRIYIPGLSIQALQGGNITTASQASIQAAAQNLLTDGNGLRVYSRKDRTFWEVQSATVPSELAVQRRRRGKVH
jgi:hypothetical protein